jgi:hypothetical protein
MSNGLLLQIYEWQYRCQIFIVKNKLTNNGLALILCGLNVDNQTVDGVQEKIRDIGWITIVICINKKSLANVWFDKGFLKLNVFPSGFEPETHTLKVYCSTS